MIMNELIDSRTEIKKCNLDFAIEQGRFCLCESLKKVKKLVNND